MLLLGSIPLIIVLEGVNVVEVFLVRDNLGASPTAYGLLEACFGAGAVTGAALTALRRTRSKGWSREAQAPGPRLR